jgi:cyclic pyranopterin phosphate synthase
VKINVVVKKDVNDQSLFDLVDHFRGTGVIVRFIEFMDVGTINHWRYAETVPSRELVARINEHWPIRPVEQNYHGEVANRYEFIDGQGELGFISSVTAPFCGSCTRARLSSDGKLFTCLFASAGIDLKGPLRSGASDAELLELICARWRSREDRYSELRKQHGVSHDKVEMYYIGG